MTAGLGVAAEGTTIMWHHGPIINLEKEFEIENEGSYELTSQRYQY
jgi:hypothetical protein